MSESLEDDFAGLCAHAHTDFGASLLVQFCKYWDLTAPECAPIVREIATWIESPSEHFRQEVCFALCFFRPVPGYEWVALRAWEQADIGTLHWIASGIGSSFRHAQQVSVNAIDVVASRLSKPSPTPDSFDESYYSFYEESLMDRVMEVSESARVLAHFCRLLRVSHPDPELPYHPSLEQVHSFVSRWQGVAVRLRQAKTHSATM